MQNGTKYKIRYFGGGEMLSGTNLAEISRKHKTKAPRKGRVSPKEDSAMWLVRPIIQKDESLSSVLLRLSTGNKLSPEKACSILFGADDKRDLDRLSPFQTSIVGDAVDLTKEQALSLTFWQWDGKIVAELSGVSSIACCVLSGKHD